MTLDWGNHFPSRIHDAGDGEFLDRREERHSIGDVRKEKDIVE
jgi:hypothetical protein